MSTLAPPRIRKVTAPPARPFKWTVDEFHEIFHSPIFEGRRLILVKGEVLDMGVGNHPHDFGIGACQEALEPIFDRNSYWIRVQMAFPVGTDTDLIPDISVAAGARATHTQQPTKSLLLVEVSDSSLDYDVGEKSNQFASASVADYWVLDTNNRRLIVFRDPVADAAAPFGFRYQTRLELDATASINPLAAPQATIKVADLLP